MRCKLTVQESGALLTVVADTEFERKVLKDLSNNFKHMIPSINIDGDEYGRLVPTSAILEVDFLNEKP